MDVGGPRAAGRRSRACSATTRRSTCGRVVTGGGVTLCIDVVLHLLERLFDARVAAETARILEYTTAWDANRQAFRAVVA